MKRWYVTRALEAATAAFVREESPFLPSSLETEPDDKGLVADEISKTSFLSFQSVMATGVGEPL
jgi:hypothetical protein